MTSTQAGHSLPGAACRWCGRARCGSTPCCGACGQLSGAHTASAADDPLLPDWFVGCATVLQDVFSERKRQVERYGLNEDLEEGTGPETRWALPASSNSATTLERLFREDYEEFEEETGRPTWVHLVREELAEAFMEPPGSPRLEEELIQVAALCVSWVERIRARRALRSGTELHRQQADAFAPPQPDPLACVGTEDEGDQ